MNTSNFGIYIHKNDNIDSSIIKELPLVGLVDNNNIYKWKSYNKFETKPTFISKDFKKLNLSHYKDVLPIFYGKNVLSIFCGKNEQIKYENAKKLFIYSVGTYYENELAFITKNNVYIHKRKINHHDFYKYLEDYWKKDGTKYVFDYDKIAKSKLDKTLFYDKKPYVINDYKKIFIGKDLGKNNSLLIQKDSNTFIFVCNNITQFKTLNNDKIIKYISHYTNGRLYPDPIIIGEKYVYIPTFEKCIKKDFIPKSFFDKSDKKSFENIIDFVINQKNVEIEKKQIFFNVK